MPSFENPVPSVENAAPSANAAYTVVPGVALMFEGGGMRGSYTCAFAATLVERGLGFEFVCGLSAGASNTVNFLTRDLRRIRESFVEIVDDPRFGSWKTFLAGKGMFSAHWIYQEAGLPDGPLPFDFEAFSANPARIAIQAFDRDSGESVVWTKEDMPTLDDVMTRVRASSTLPLVMPPVTIDGRVYYDGGLGAGGGLTLDLALESGCERVLAVLTRPRGYRKTAPDRRARAIANLYRNHPFVREALLTRHERYNETLDRLEGLAREGRAAIVYADKMSVESSTVDRARLEASYADGYEQAAREMDRLREWLGA